MKPWIPYFFLLILVASCGHDTSKTNTDTNAVEEEVSITLTAESSPIPLLDFEDLEVRYLNQMSDKILVLNFWATWCKPCVKELPAFEKLGASYKEQGVKVVLVSLDFPEHMEKAVVPFIEKNGLKSDIVLLDDPDANTWIPKVSSGWSGAIPATVIIKNGQRYFFEQSFTFETLLNEIQPLLNK